ncbi:hypothetical protein [Rhodococcus erythropolis]|uniref:hypothetical protein n=1 Tax=Rhodococcus erythropolis TaxID=1833 RepID=UPI003013715C
MTLQIKPTKWKFPKQTWGVRQKAKSTWMNPILAEALRRTVHTDPATGRKVSQNIIIHTALLRIPEVHKHYLQLKKEEKLSEGGTTDRAKR